MTLTDRIAQYVARAYGAPTYADRAPLSQDEYRRILGKGADLRAGSAILVQRTSRGADEVES